MANNNHNNRISILIVDDHEVVRNGIRSYLETVKEFQVVGEAASGEMAVKLVSELIPDIVLLDLIMPGMDGVETTRQIKHISPRTQVVVLTSYHEDVHIFPALKAGAISYILKDMKMAFAILTFFNGFVVVGAFCAIMGFVRLTSPR